MPRIQVLATIAGGLVWTAGCANPSPPARGPNFEAVVLDAGPDANGQLRLLVTTVAPDVPGEAVIELPGGASTLEQQRDGGFVRQRPSASWRGRMVRVWFSHGFAVRPGEPFSAPAEAVVVEPARSSVDP